MARVLILAGDPAESLEVLYPYERLSKKGYEVHKGARVPVGGSVHGGVAGTFEARWGIARLTHDSYAAIIAQTRVCRGKVRWCCRWKSGPGNRRGIPVATWTAGRVTDLSELQVRAHGRWVGKCAGRNASEA